MGTGFGDILDKKPSKFKFRGIDSSKHSVFFTDQRDKPRNFSYPKNVFNLLR